MYYSNILTPQDVFDVVRLSRRPSLGQSGAAVTSAPSGAAAGPAAVSDLLAATIRNTEEKVVEVRRRAEEAVQEVSELSQLL